MESFIEKCRIKRTKREHIAYYLSSLITGKPRHQYRNHWIRHQGEKWQPDFNWDKLFPNVESGTLKSALLQYWDNYYAKAEEYEKIYPKNFRIFEIDALNSSFGQQEILEFCGLKEHTNFKEFHVNKST